MPNTKGGKKHKRNKKQNDYVEKALRLKEEDQEYAQITRCLGNCRFTVMCFDGKERLATMCGSMRGRKFINQNNIVLVSLREWQDEKCDIIEGTIFIGMCARHYDSPKRQIAMYLTGIKILNRIFERI